MVRGVTREIYDALKDQVTVFPKQGILRVNFDTAPEAVLAALARAMSTVLPDVAPSDADALVEKSCATAREKTAPFLRVTTGSSISMKCLLTPRRGTCSWRCPNFARTPRIICASVSRELKKVRGAKTVIEAVVYRNDLSTLQWQRN